MKIFTTGYTGKKIEQLPALIDFHKATLADIRFDTNSRQLQWTKDYLSLMLKNRYIHVPALGNRSYKNDDTIQIQNLEIGIRLVESWQMNVILLCACEKLENCHRRIVNHEFETRGYETEEITDWNITQPSFFG